MLDLQSIQQALLVAEHLSIRRAAAHLGLQSSAVSRRLQALENVLGVSLFERHATGVQPTIAGRRFLDRARWALAELDYAVYSATSIQEGQEGALAIAFYPFLESDVLRRILAEYHERHPRLEFSFLEAPAADQLVALRQGRVDVAFLTSERAIPGIESEQLWSERVSVALPKEHPLAHHASFTWNDILEQPFLVCAYGGGPAIHAWLVGKHEAGGRAPDIRQHDMCRDSLLGLVGAGYGITAVAGNTTELAIPGVVFRPVADERAVVAVRMAWRGDTENPALARFLSHARRVARRVQSER